MKIVKICSLVFLISLSLFAEEEKLFKDLKKQIEITYSIYQNVTIGPNEICKVTCLSKSTIETTSKDIVKKMERGPGGRNPAAALCPAIGAEPDIYYYENGDAVTICLFKDKSFIVAWNLFDKLFKK